MQVNRPQLLAAVGIVRAALVSRPYVQSLSHILSAGGWLTTYNESIAITTKLDAEVADLDCCIEGERLYAALSQFAGTTLDVKVSEGALTLKSGKSIIKLGTLPAADFLFETPTLAGGNRLAINQIFIDGITSCLVGVSKDEALPAAMGVTMSTDAGVDNITLYSTDNKTITRFQTDLPWESMTRAATILPAQFCEQLVSLYKTLRCTHVWMHLGDVQAVVRFDDHTVLTARLQSEYEVINYEDKIQGLCPLETIAAGAMRIPDGIDGALGRAVLVLGNESNLAVRFECAPGTLALDASTATSSSHDDLVLDDYAGDGLLRFNVDPALVARGIKQCDSMLPLPGVLVMLGAKGRLIHLVAHVAR